VPSVPRFHLHVYNGLSLPDSRGVDLPDRDAARVEALRLAAELIRDGATRRRLGRDWRMEVTDASGTLLFRLDFTVVDG
jgi:hypothetical protein